MNEEAILKFCKEKDITVFQYFLFYAVQQKWIGFDQPLRFMQRSRVQQTDLIALIRAGLVTNDDVEGDIDIHCLKIHPDFDEAVTEDDNWADDIWDKYPPLFPLGDGRHFVARTGMPKRQLVDAYKAIIKHDRKKHEFVMEMLDKFTNLVLMGKTNGVKITRFVEEEMWDIVAMFETDRISTFKEDI
jgi:hypothetical protein